MCILKFLLADVSDKRARTSLRVFSFTAETMVGPRYARNDCARAGGAAHLHEAANRARPRPGPAPARAPLELRARTRAAQ